jgi:hypothetical protein
MANRESLNKKLDASLGLHTIGHKIAGEIEDVMGLFQQFQGQETYYVYTVVELIGIVQMDSILHYLSTHRLEDKHYWILIKWLLALFKMLQS